MAKIYKIFLIISLFLAAGAGCNRAVVQTAAPSNVSAPETTNPYTVSLRIGDRQLLVNVADTDAARTRGLSGSPRLTDSQGMLFDMRGTGQPRPGFWMKDMLFNLDLIWIADGRVVGITPNVPAPQAPDSALPLYYPPAPVDMVLEVNAGWTAVHQVKTGDGVSL